MSTIEESKDAITDNIEENAMRTNLPALKKRWQDSIESGVSDIVI